MPSQSVCNWTPRDSNTFMETKMAHSIKSSSITFGSYTALGLRPEGWRKLLTDGACLSLRRLMEPKCVGERLLHVHDGCANRSSIGLTQDEARAKVDELEWML
ncbi:hypothetical protein WG66_002302 [Moniliophthora roreri]|nr:hypothetical protein WG66_002302 [Moniliophthora roreri]